VVAKSYQTIVKSPLQQRRVAVAQKFINNELNTDTFLDEAIALRDQLAGAEPKLFRMFDVETQAVLDFLQTGVSSAEPHLLEPELQLLWGMALATAISDKKITEKWPDDNKIEDLTGSPIWDQLTATAELSIELAETQLDVANVVRRPVDVDWGAPPMGYPGVGYYFDLQNEYINLDLVWSLIIGVEHARGATMHEIAHGQGTLEFTPRMQALYQEMEELKSKKWNKEYYIAFTKLNAEWRTRHFVWDEAENNYANRFAANRGDVTAQDYSASLNHVESLLVDSVRDTVPPPASELEGEIAAAQNQQMQEDPTFKYFVNFKRALRYAFFANNDFMPNTPEGWKEVGVDIDLLASGLPKEISLGRSGQQVLADILEECRTLEETQPHPREKMFGSEYFQQRIEDANLTRNNVIDQVFERYVVHIVPEIQKQVEAQAEKIAAMIEMIEALIAEGKTSIFIEGIGEVSICELPAENPREDRLGKDQGERKLKDDKPSDDKKPKRDYNGPMAISERDSKVRSDPKSTAPIARQQYTFNHNLSPGELSDYEEAKKPLDPVITRTAGKFKNLVVSISQRVSEDEARYDLVPEDGDIERFDLARHADLMTKLMTGQSVEMDDYQKFRNDSVSFDTDHPKMIVLFDNSGSSYHRMGSDTPLRLEVIRDAAIVMLESAHAAGWESALISCGGSRTDVLADFRQPVEFKRRIIAGHLINLVKQVHAGNAIGCGHEGCPACKVPQEALKSGFTETFKLVNGQQPTLVSILSDGEIYDINPAIAEFKKRSQGKRYFYCNGIIANQFETALEKLSKENIGSTKTRPSFRRVQSSQQIEASLSDLLARQMPSVRTGLNTNLGSRGNLLHFRM
jgi:hypothetical protein